MEIQLDFWGEVFKVSRPMLRNSSRVASANATVADKGEGQAAESREPCKLYLKSAILKRIALVAAIQDKSRSAVVEAILEEHLPKYQVKEIPREKAST